MDTRDRPSGNPATTASATDLTLYPSATDPSATLLGLFLAQVAQTPSATAVLDEHSGRTLTYAELDRCARSTAARVTALLADQAAVCAATEAAAAAAAAAASSTALGGAQQAPKVNGRMQRTAAVADADKSVVAVSGADRPVGVCAHGLAAVVGVLAAWRLGRPFLALDPAHPPARLQQLARSVPLVALLHDGPEPPPGAPPAWFRGLADTGSDTGDTGGQPAAVVAACALDPGSAGDAAGHGPGPGPGLPRPPGSGLAYIMFTSGSTGTPKAVLGSHHAMLHRFRWMLAAFPIAATDVCSQTKPIAFVDFVWDCFGPLAAGATLAVPPPAAKHDVGELGAHLERTGCTRLTLVPSVLAALLAVHDGAAEAGDGGGREGGEGTGAGAGGRSATTASTSTVICYMLRAVRMLTVSGEAMTAGVFLTWAFGFRRCLRVSRSIPCIPPAIIRCRLLQVVWHISTHRSAHVYTVCVSH